MLHVPLREKTTLLVLLYIIMPNLKFLTKSHIVSWISELKASLEWLSQSSREPDLRISWRIKALNGDVRSTGAPWQDWRWGEDAWGRLAWRAADELPTEDSAHHSHSLSPGEVSYGDAGWSWWLCGSLWSFWWDRIQEGHWGAAVAHLFCQYLEGWGGFGSARGLGRATCHEKSEERQRGNWIRMMHS